MKILIVVDIFEWAIGKLSKVIQKNNPHLGIKIIAIHPKDLRNRPEELKDYFINELKQFNPDIIHFQYWDTANTLSQMEECRGKKIILTHHNQKNLLSHDWKLMDKIVVHTKKSKEIIEDAGYSNIEIIQHGIDIKKFKFFENYDENNRMLGYTGRIVPWKGLYDILKIAKELNSEVVIQGRIDKGDYWQKCQEFSEQMDIRLNTPNEKQTEVYHEMGVYIGNSSDNIEEGTLGLIEAMACGIPVVTTPSGEAIDIIKDGENGILVNFENYESLKKGIEKMLSLSKEEKNKMREAAWNTVKNMNGEVMSRRYERLYYKTLYRNDLVSVIIPTFQRSEVLRNVLQGYLNQTYKPIEIVVVDDFSKDENKTRNMVLKFNEETRDRIAVKYLNTNHEGYGLAKARNIGIFEATGNYLLITDDRYLPNQDTVEVFVESLKSHKEPSAVWGNKGAGRRDFMENFFMIRKKHIADAGMFNERIDKYGGQSQEIRDRLKNLGYNLIYQPQAIASPIIGTHNRSRKRYEILEMKTKLWKLRN